MSSMDLSTLRTVYELHQSPIFSTLANAPYLRSAGNPDSHLHILDGWDARNVSLALAAAHEPSDDAKGKGVQARFVVTCTPSPHGANRGLLDRWHTLWSSWAVEEVFPSSSSAPSASTGGGATGEAVEGGRAPRKVYFAGDTGYRTVADGEDEDTVPRCPAFAEIGEILGPFDLALLPIGCTRARRG
ncbi:hypothetical protein BD414DRAFT_495076 [Trametes punicea]|nr:hypothetical protein BD414DRAFT_495076 [Trametes punicea]